jgi:diguanylate cyclase (GGDEF)-like protein
MTNPATGAEPHAAAPAILIVDDAPASIATLREMMLQQGYQVLVATSGPRALDIAERAHPDLVLLDVTMPDMDGLETCRRLKSHTATADIPVIFVSGRTDTADIVAGFDMGASDYIAKPPHMAEVCARVRAQLHRMRSANALQRAALADPLTRIANRRHFDNFLEREWHRALRNATPLSLLLLDVDHFKLCNDTLGHATGDACLQKVAHVLQAHALRPTDLAARYGGEEFVLLLAETPLDAAAAIAGRIRAEVEALHLPNPRAPNCEWLTVSIGVTTTVPTPRDAVGELFAAADRQMYAAKAAGRNRVVTGRVGGSGAADGGPTPSRCTRTAAGSQ